MKEPTYHFEQARFIGAVDTLIAARKAGINMTGLTAYMSIENFGLRPLLQFSYEEIYNREHKERLQKMGQFVELAADMSEHEPSKSE